MKLYCPFCGDEMEEKSLETIEKNNCAETFGEYACENCGTWKYTVDSVSCQPILTRE
jgi:uncharacterized protein YbaR (Trm112 family)